MHIETARLLITDFNMDMCADVHRNSLDEDNRRFVPDEVFETLEEAQETVAFLMQACRGTDGPFVYPILRKKDSANIGYVQLCRVQEGYEVGYHIGKAYTGYGYATEAVKSFLPAAMEAHDVHQVYGVVLEANTASQRVLEKCGFILFYQGVDSYQGELKAIRKYLFSK